MRITKLSIRNYRTLESVDLVFPSLYSAICGQNDSGKTNIVRAIRAFVREESPFDTLFSHGSGEFSLQNDFPKFNETKEKERFIQFTVDFVIKQQQDAGFYEFLKKQLTLNHDAESLAFQIETKYFGIAQEPTVKVTVLETVYDGLAAQEVLQKLQSSRSVLVHNSIRIESGFPFGPPIGQLGATSQDEEALVASMKRTVNKGLAKLSKTHKQELETLLGRLGTKYDVGLSVPAFDFASVPFNITLGHKKYDVPLDDCGSGTRNRTLILLTLFRAKRVSDAEPSAAKTTPIIIVEEPESFLHPSAQASFGKVLQDLATEFGVQVIATTHSPYLLSLEDASSNILLERRSYYGQPKETVIVQTAGEQWMEPFSRALGLAAAEFKPWKNLIRAGSDAVLLVEGEIDRRYLEMLRDTKHGSHRLAFEGDIVSYEGTGSLSNTVLLRFVQNRHRKFFVTFDLDAAARVGQSLHTLGMERGKHYMPVGINAPGKRTIEGLLPERIIAEVSAVNAPLVQQATTGTREEQESAKLALKKLYLEHFSKTAKPGDEDFGHFYALVRTINQALA